MSARRLVVVPHTHWDREWYRTHEAFRYRLVRLMDGLLALLEGEPGFRHFTLDGQTIVVDDYLAIRPAARERIAKLVTDGRLLIGPWRVLPDEWLVSGEALIRNLRMGLEDAARLGGAMQVGYVPDQFGHVGQLPQIFAGFGFETAVLWRGVGGDVDRGLFHWEAPDGTRLLTAHLARGYGNAVHLPRDPEALAGRLRAEAEAEGERAAGASVLLMNGSDHVAPDPGLPDRLAAAAAQLPDLELEIGSLPIFLERARREAPGDLPVHRGELRSGLRAPILAGCASSRMPQKRADFANDRLLTRYLEPLSAWLQRSGGDGDPELLDAIWRIALENHPHDSICGCSIDAVHDQMDTRFQRVRELAGAHLETVCAELAARVAPAPGDGAAVCAWNPHGGGAALAEGRVELPCALPAGSAVALEALDARGRARPVDARVVREAARYAEYALPCRVVAALVRGFPPEFFGDPVQRAGRRREGEREIVEVWLGARAAPGFDWESRRAALAEALEAEGERPALFRPWRLPLLDVRIPGVFPGAGLRSFRLREVGEGGGAGAVGSDGPRVSAAADAGGARLENETWRVRVTPDGRVHCTHLPSGRAIEDALRLVSEGDRGDSYTFDPVPGAAVVREPEEVRVALGACSAARAEVCVDLALRVPAALRPDRAGRSDDTVLLPARLGIALAAGIDRVDVRVGLDNTARDHRLRLHVAAPFAADRFEVESAFEVAERPIAPGPEAFGEGRPAELPSGATPQRRFAVLRGGGSLLCVASRGLAEAAAVPEGARTALAVTLLRATGWLSRDDLARRPGHAGPPVETPGAQVPGPHEGEVAIFLRAEGDASHRAEALRFAEPPLVFAGEGAVDAPLRDGARLVEIEDPEIVLSALEPLADGGTGLRIHNASSQPRRATLRWTGGGAGLRRVDLRGRPLDARAPSPSLDLSLRPHEIVALRAD